MGLPLLVAIAVFAVVFVGGGQSPRSSAQNAGGQNQQSAGNGNAGQSSRPAMGGKKNAEASAKSGLGHPALGSEGAPVVMIDYSDYQ